MDLTNSDIVELTEWRRLLHRFPEVSGEERETAARVAVALHALGADRVVTGLGGHGVAAVFEGRDAGATVMLRSELDALPIEEISDAGWRSSVPGKGHLCGHDGHSTILMGVARILSRQRPARGRVVLMFQPAEEDGSGAAAVIADPRFAGLAPDWAFSLHNMPGLPFGTAGLTEGPVNCASRGLKIRLTGKTSHASVPEAGVSPAPALARLIPALTALGPGGAVVPGYLLATVTHARLGAEAFGIAPGEAEVWVTLRTLLDEDMADLLFAAMELAETDAARDGLAVGFTHHDDFAASVNDVAATQVFRAALAAEGVPVTDEGLPMRGSEDFGRFGQGARSAMIFLGVGRDHPMLHNPDYDFPDALIPLGARIFTRVVRDLLG